MVCIIREYGINPSHPFLNSSLLEGLLMQLFFQRARIVKACCVAEDKLKKISFSSFFSYALQHK